MFQWFPAFREGLLFFLLGFLLFQKILQSKANFIRDFDLIQGIPTQ
jgi:hypothetical protein